MPRTVVVVGASVGGVRTAQALRREGHDGPIVLVGAEPHLPYDKPPLSKQFLTGAWFVGAATANWPKALATCRRMLADRADIDEIRECIAALSATRSAVTSPNPGRS